LPVAIKAAIEEMTVATTVVETEGMTAVVVVVETEEVVAVVETVVAVVEEDNFELRIFN
jgi:hypothetical protein